MTIPPGSTIGVLGGGQLGRMLALAAANLGYRTHVYAPGMSGPAAEIAARWTHGAYDDAKAIAAFVAQVDVVTYEFENIDLPALRGLRGIYPPPSALEIAQDRLAEKRFAEQLGGRPAKYRQIDSVDDLGETLRDFDGPSLLKTRRFGYDGKGQLRIDDPASAEQAWAAIGGQPAVLEEVVSFEAEFSILLVRDREGRIACWDAVTNWHRDGVLQRSCVPPTGIVAAQAEAATRLTERIAGALDYVGVLACEFFATADGPLFNEMAPRVHNSGHWTIEGAVTSQFENHIRAICGLPLGSTALVGQGAEMRNLLGSETDQWPTILADPDAHLHLYGKSDNKPGRKTGHVTHVLR